MKTILTLIHALTLCTVFSQSTSIYVSDAGNFHLPPWQILKFDGNGQNPSVFINTHLNWPQDILFLGDSIVLISNFGSGTIKRHNATTGTYISDFATGLAGPTRMKIGSDSLLYVLQWNGIGYVKRFQLDGTPLGNFTSMGVSQSIGIDWDADGNLYVSSYDDDLIRKFDTAGTDMGIFVNSNLAGPTNIWFDANGDLLVLDYDGTSVKRFDSAGNFQGDFITGLDNCEGVAFMPNGNILIGNGGTHSVKLFDSSGNYIQDIIPNGSGNLINPNAIVVRESKGVGIDEHPKSENLIFPTKGTKFTINEEVFHEAKSISVYNTSGQLIEKLNTPNWYPTQQVDGIYLIVFDLKDGSQKVQKVIIERP